MLSHGSSAGLWRRNAFSGAEYWDLATRAGKCRDELISLKPITRAIGLVDGTSERGRLARVPIGRRNGEASVRGDVRDASSFERMSCGDLS
jgi:hypothetical protein